MSYREISEVTELSVGNVGYLLHTALNQLRRELNVQSSINGDLIVAAQRVTVDGNVDGDIIVAGFDERYGATG